MGSLFCSTTNPGQPIIVCGCHGGGTSLVAKLLRLSGLFMGADAGPISDRKHHESRAFRHTNMRLLARYGDVNGMTESSVARAIAQFSSEFYSSSAARSTDVAVILSQFFGPGERKAPWGWKDPRNSLTYPVWKTIFPEARAIIVNKHIDVGPSKSSSGRWFRMDSTAVLRKQYMDPWWLAGNNNAIQLNFDDLITSPDAYNTMLAFCSLPPISRPKFKMLLKEADLECSSHRDKLILDQIT